MRGFDNDCRAPEICVLPHCAEERERRERQRQQIRDAIGAFVFLSIIGGSILAHGIR